MEYRTSVLVSDDIDNVFICLEDGTKHEIEIEQFMISLRNGGYISDWDLEQETVEVMNPIYDDTMDWVEVPKDIDMVDFIQDLMAKDIKWCIKNILKNKAR